MKRHPFTVIQIMIWLGMLSSLAVCFLANLQIGLITFGAFVGLLALLRLFFKDSFRLICRNFWLDSLYLSILSATIIVFAVIIVY